MLIRTKLALNLGVQLVLVLLLALSLWWLARSYEQLETTQSQQVLGHQLAVEVRESSDELTQMARLFVVTREPRFATYFREISRIRDGVLPRPPEYDAIYWDLVRANAAGHRKAGAGRHQALLDRLRLAGFKPAEFALLDEAKRRSDALIQLEEGALGSLENGRNAAPELSDSAWRQALGLMHGPAYLQAKAHIMLPLRQFAALVETRLNTARAAAELQVRRGLQAVCALVAGLALHALVSAFSFDRSVRVPLGQLRGWARAVRAGRLGTRTRIEGEGELAELSAVIDALSESTQRQLAELQDEVARRKRAEAVIQHLDNHDALTGLPSLRLLHDRLERAVSHAQRQHQGVALLHVKLQGIGPGKEGDVREIGEMVLKVLAQRLAAALREADTVGRIGGHEFLLILPDLASLDAAAQLKSKLAATLAEPVFVAAQQAPLRLTAAIGVAVYPGSATDMHGLLRLAELDMQRDPVTQA